MKHRSVENHWDHRLCTVVESSMETRFHAANHTIPPQPSCEDSPTPRQGQKPLAVSRRKNPTKMWKTITSTVGMWCVFWGGRWVVCFAEGERFLSFWRCHRSRRERRQGGGVSDSSRYLKSDMPQCWRQVRSTGIGKRMFFLCFLFLFPQHFFTEP